MRGRSAPWLYLLSAWDTVWYVQMANTLRFRLDRPFFPAYLLFIKALTELLGDYWLSACLISLRRRGRPPPLLETHWACA